MCVRYVNANIALFRKVIKDNTGIVGFSQPFDCIVSQIKGNTVFVDSFCIVTYLTLMESRDNKANNWLDVRETVDVCIRLTKSSNNPDKRISIDLDTFTIATENSEDIMYDACVPYLNFKRITYVSRINLDIENPRGDYAVKVLVKTPADKIYTLQSMHPLRID